MTPSRVAMAVILVVAAVGLAGCHSRSPVVRACMAAVGVEAGSLGEDRCNCIDDIARRQLNPEAYAALERAAVAAESKGGLSPTRGAVASGQEAARLMVRLDPAERALAEGDGGFVVVKAAVRCR